MRPKKGWNLKWTRRNTLVEFGGIVVGYIVSVGVDVARLCLLSESRGLPPSPPF